MNADRDPNFHTPAHGRNTVRGGWVPCMAGVLAAAALVLVGGPVRGQQDGDQLLRLGYHSEVTDARREYFVYLPSGYREDASDPWPVILFLHGNGQRGDGLGDLDYVMRHGPLMEAWLQRRPLPFIIISPQLPLFGAEEAIADRERHARPRRLDAGTPPRNHGYPPQQGIQPNHLDGTSLAGYSSQAVASQIRALPPGWKTMHGEVVAILDTVLGRFNADPGRVYLTGISLGGFGTFSLAAVHPERFAAIAPIVGAASPGEAGKIAGARLPIWLIGGGQDSVVDPGWLYETARVLEQAGHPNLRFTMHEDMDHDAWKRVYEGRDLFDWFLRFSAEPRPAPEKSFD